MPSSQQMNQNTRKYELNSALSILQVFNPLNDYHIHHINQSTSPILLHDLIKQARKTTRFTIDTEDDYYTHQPALIQIEFIQDKSIILLIEINHLPHPSSIVFWLIRSLLKVILHSLNVIYSWGDAKDELSKFIPSRLLSSETLLEINNMNIQKIFKNWHDRKPKRQCISVSLDTVNRLYTYSRKSTTNFNHKWSLQMAIAYAFHEFLDKSRTKSRWIRNLDMTNNNRSFVVNLKVNRIVEEMIEYAVNDCFAVTKLVSMLKLDRINI
ncbi:unnamed protein product [Rotaria sp. Silwood2]|nr:unnamed protein product [Rotaria sp. Silwood2]CAF4397105.1 unnamed protein product [Rotaria sp. Silwood2]